MFSEVIRKKIVKIIIWLNWFNVGVEILSNLILLLWVLGWASGLRYNPLLHDFLWVNRSFINRNGFYLIAFFTGLMVMGIRLNVLLTNAVEKCDEKIFLTWLKRSALCTIVEWGLIGYMSLPFQQDSYFIMISVYISALAWIYIILRIIYPVVSYFIIFRIFFYVQFRSEDYKSIQSPIEV